MNKTCCKWMKVSTSVALLSFALLACGKREADERKSSYDEKNTAAHDENTVPVMYLQGFIVIGNDSTDDRYSFYKPSEIKFDKAGCLYVLDSGNNRVMKYDPYLHFIKQIGRVGQGPGELINPSGLALDDAHSVYTLDRGNSRVMIFDKDGKYLSSFKIPDLILDRNIAVDSRGKIYVDLPVNGTLLKIFSSTGQNLANFGMVENYNNPTATWVYNDLVFTVDVDGTIYAAYTNKPVYVRYSPRGELELQKVISGSEIAEQLRAQKKLPPIRPQGTIDSVVFFWDLVLTPDHNLLAMIGGCKAIYLLDTEGNVLKKYLTPAAQGKEIYTTRIGLSRDGVIFGLDTFNYTVVKYLPSERR